VGYSWFRQSFKRVTGISPAQYISRLLTSRAKEMLVSEQQTISETAYALGFESVGQFSTLFRKIEGVTPRQFRDENKLSYDQD
jgi:AraC-like DNA-binding protein